MKILAFDTATAVASAAVVEDKKLLGVQTLNLNKPHSQKIMPVIEQLLAELELTPADIDLFCVAKGPGSFTGLRIGIAAAKGFSFATGKPLVGVGTLEALASCWTVSGQYVCPVIDARRNQVYNGLYRAGEDGLAEVISPNVSDISHLAARLSCFEKEIIFTGDAAYRYQDLLREQLGDLAIFPPEALCVNSAVSVALLGGEIYQKEGTHSQLVPDYLIPTYVDQKKTEDVKQ